MPRVFLDGIPTTRGDDSSDCQFSAGRVAAAAFDDDAPDVAAQKALYAAVDPDWTPERDRRGAPDPDLVWEMWRRLGWEILGLHDLPDPWAMARRCLAAGRPLIIWTRYPLPAVSRYQPARTLNHAELLIGMEGDGPDTELAFWEQQRGNWHSVRLGDFLTEPDPARGVGVYWLGGLWLLQPAGLGYPPEERPMSYYVGVGAPNGPADLTEMLATGARTFLVLDVAGVEDHVRQIRAADPDARIIVRLMGGRPGGDPEADARSAAIRARYFVALGAGDSNGEIDIIGWNEIDRGPDHSGNGEGYWRPERDPAEQVAEVCAYAERWVAVLRAECPEAILHWPAWAHIDRYNQPGQWTATAQLFDVFDAHAYYLTRWPALFASYARDHLGGMPTLITEFNHGPGNALPANYGDWIRDYYRNTAVAGLLGAVWFIWDWQHPEPGGEGVSAVANPAIRDGIRAAAAELAGWPHPGWPRARRPEPAPEPEPEPEPLTNRERYEPHARRVADEFGLDPDLYVRLITQESGWNPAATSPSGAFGLAQFSQRYYPDVVNWSPERQLYEGARLLASHRDYYGGDYALALAAYNAGKLATDNWLKEYGSDWRAALRLYPDQWARIATYGDAAKAEQVARYIDIILGPEETTMPDNSDDLAAWGITDRRGQLPTLTGNWPRLSYHDRPRSAITHTTIHYTAAPAHLSAEQIAAYQVSDAAAGQTGAGQPFPGIAYTLYIPEDGSIELCHDLDVQVWHADAPGWNAERIGICFGGTGRPNDAQLAGLARAHVWCENELGWQLGLSGHQEGSRTSCPGIEWRVWKSDLQAAIERERQSMSDGPTDPAGIVELTELWRVLHLLEGMALKRRRAEARAARETGERMVDALKRTLGVP